MHPLVEEAPQMLPLAGRASLTVLGREIQLGNGYADLIAVEPTRRHCVTEGKRVHGTEAGHADVVDLRRSRNSAFNH